MFSLYNCTGGVCQSGCTNFVTSLSVPVNGNGIYASGSYTPTQQGDYFWVAAYSGDTNNTAVSTTCGDSGESVEVSLAELATSPSPSVPLGQAISDTATVSGPANAPTPSGEVVFSLYEAISGCTGDPVTMLRGTLVNGVVSSGPFVSAVPDQYAWVADYLGDSNYRGTITACGDEDVNVLAIPTITTDATSSAVGGERSRTRPLSPPPPLTPADPSRFRCTRRATRPAPPHPSLPPWCSPEGIGNYDSRSFDTTQAGVYHWIAVYSGDQFNLPASTHCGDPNEGTTVSTQSVILTAQASPPGPVTLGSPINDSISLTGGEVAASGGTLHTGTLLISVFGPNNASCGGVPAFTASDTVMPGVDSYTIQPPLYVPTAAGSYNFVVSYGGDAGDSPAFLPCGSPN
ncbi:MAG: hypothetical protein ACRDYC_01030 [Acidimicrobiales bacterium]